MKTKTLLLLTLALLAAGSAAALTVEVKYYGSLDFSPLRTYAWQKGTPAANHEIEKEIRATVDAHFAAGGWQRSDGAADLYVRTHAGKNPTFLYVALVVEVYEASMGQLVWRGQATDVQPEKARKAKSIVRKVVKKMFKSFPEVKAP